MQLYKSDENIWYLHEYYPARYIEHIGISEKISGIKNSDRNAIEFFVSEMNESMPKLFEDMHANPSDMIVCVMPSHVEGKYSDGLVLLADKVCSHFRMRSALYLIKRIKNLQKKDQGGSTDTDIILESLDLNHSIDIQGKSVIVLDDVTTTGISMKAARELLLRYGAENVFGITLGKTVFGTEREEMVPENEIIEENTVRDFEIPGIEMDDTEDEYQEIDMSKEARHVANCVFESKGKYGISAISDILRGKEDERSSETYGMHFRTRESLKDTDEIMIKCLILKMIQEGYLARNAEDGALIFGNNIERLKNPGTKVMVDVPAKKAQINLKKPDDFVEDTEDLTSIGYELLNKLIALRQEIADSLSVPKESVFGDKSLLQMCMLTPKNKPEMLHVSGVGVVKNKRYGERFLAVIRDFVEHHSEPTAHVNILADEVRRKEEKKQRSRKKEFFLTSDQAVKFEYADVLAIFEVKERLNAIREGTIAKPATIRAILDFLYDNEYLSEEFIDGQWHKVIYEKGETLGLHCKKRRVEHDREIEVVMIPRAIQKILVEYFVESGTKLNAKTGQYSIDLIL